jgi:putative peptidoglycan lipid II flippase
VLFAEVWVLAFASGYESRPDVYADTIRTTRIVFPYIVLMGIAALMTGALQARRSFGAGAFAPAMLNVAFVLAPFTLLPLGNHLGWAGTTVLGVTALVGGLLHVLALLPALRSAGLVVRPVVAFSDPAVRRALWLLAPLLLGLGVYQLNVAISRQFLSHLPDGSMSYLYYAQRLVEIPQGMFALAIGSAALPSVATTMARGDAEGSKRILREALRLTLFVAIPSSVALAVLATPIVSALFGHGRFDANAVTETARSLVYQSIGIAAVSAVRTIVPMFHGMKDTRTPVLASATNLVFFAVAAYLSVPTMGHAGVALALTLASAAQLLVLLVLLRVRTGPLGAGDVFGAVIKTTVASALAGVGMYFASRYGQAALGELASSALVKLAAVAIYALVGALVFLGAARALRLDEVGRIFAGLRRKLRPPAA